MRTSSNVPYEKRELFVRVSRLEVVNNLSMLSTFQSE